MVAKNLVRRGTWMNSCSLVSSDFPFPFSVVEDDWRVDADSAAGVVRVWREFSKFPLSSSFSVLRFMSSPEIEAILLVEIVGSLSIVLLLLLFEGFMESVVFPSLTLLLLMLIFNFFIA